MPEIEVGPVEAGHLHKGSPQFQQTGDVPADVLRGGGGEGRHHGTLGQGLQKVRDPPVAGTEVLAPLGDAVGLIHRRQGDPAVFN